MTERDPESVRRTLLRLSVPPERPRFFDQLHARMHEQDRALARRWRRTTVAFAALAVAAIAAATVLAATYGGGSTIDRTVSCATPSGGVAISAFATIPTIKTAGFSISSDPTTVLVGFDTSHSGMTLTGPACGALRKTVPLTRSGLPSAGVYRAGNYRGLDGHCPARGHLVARVRLHLDSQGKPQGATVALRSEIRSRLRPIAFVQWSPKRTLTYLSPRCVTG